jgi:hypothetical protein
LTDDHIGHQTLSKYHFPQKIEEVPRLPAWREFWCWHAGNNAPEVAVQKYYGIFCSVVFE